MTVGGQKLELVAPAGGWDHLVAALNAGADAVYLGYSRFGARAYADNFDLPLLKKAVLLAHERGIKVYLTLNTLLKDSELEEAARFLDQYLQVSQDGIIIQDLGIYKMISDLFPQARMHASTQLNIHNLDSALQLESMGFKRVVLAREMTLGQIKEISSNCNLELEVFGHGSQCYAFSGQCYLSSFASGRSGNRGRCSQPCRMKYKFMYKDEKGAYSLSKKHQYYLSKKDLSTLDLIPQMAAAGINALKIEGRMKTPEYVAIVTSIYRKYIDLYYESPKDFQVEEKDRYKLGQIFLRDSGTGYLKEEYPKDIVNMKTSGSIGTFIGRIASIDYQPKKKKIESITLQTRVPVQKGDLLEIWTNKGNERITVNQVELIHSKGKKDFVKISLNKDLWLSENDRVFKYFDHKLDGEAKSYYLYNQKKPHLQAVTQQPGLREYELNYYFSSPKPAAAQDREIITPVQLSAKVYDFDSIIAAADSGAKHITYEGEINDKWLDMAQYCSKGGSSLFISIPRIIDTGQFKRLKQSLKELAGKTRVNLEVENPGGLTLLKDVPQLKESKIIVGRGLNIFNWLSTASLEKEIGQKIVEIELSNELNIEEISRLINQASGRKKLEFSMFGHGYFPVMAAKYKPEFIDKRYQGGIQYYMEDVKGFKFRVGSDTFGNIILFNSKKICTLFSLESVLKSGLSFLRIDSRFLQPKQLSRVMDAYQQAIAIMVEKGLDKYRLFVQGMGQDELFKDYTRGHLLRGVK
ncbi:MAG: U32 family peptidase [Actinomycetota bacterium]|nr:U32 family peptidase [Actinomycetota bacterium]